jgi:hypothetical protein
MEQLTMSTDVNHELINFHQFVAQQLNIGEVLSPEEALDAWRMQHPCLQQHMDDVLALREAIADLEARDTGIPLDRFRAEFRQRHGLDSTS